MVAHRLDYKDYHSAPGEKRQNEAKREDKSADERWATLFCSLKYAEPRRYPTQNS